MHAAESHPSVTLMVEVAFMSSPTPPIIKYSPLAGLGTLCVPHPTCTRTCITGRHTTWHVAAESGNITKWR